MKLLTKLCINFTKLMDHNSHAVFRKMIGIVLKSAIDANKRVLFSLVHKSCVLLSFTTLNCAIEMYASFPMSEPC